MVPLTRNGEMHRACMSAALLLIAVPLLLTHAGPTCPDLRENYARRSRSGAPPANFLVTGRSRKNAPDHCRHPGRTDRGAPGQAGTQTSHTGMDADATVSL